VLLGCFLFDAAFPVAADLVSGRSAGSSQSAMNGALRFACVTLAILAMFPAGAAAATSITGEREQDTWVSLATTLLTPGEVIRAKQAGALWSARWLGLALFLTLATGMILGAIHPLGVLAAIATIGIASWLAASIGVFFSTRAKNSTRALIFTCVTLLFGANAWPAILWASLFSYKDLGYQSSQSGGTIGPFFLHTMGAAWIIAVYGTIAFALTWSAIRRLRKMWGEF
jgi:hypothetical protein